MPHQVELPALVVPAQIDAELQVRQVPAFARRHQLHVGHVGIDERFPLMGFLQVFFRLFETQMVSVIDVEMKLPHRDGFFRAAGFAPTLDSQCIHLATSSRGVAAPAIHSPF
ncbi:hypothetical protein D3C76_1519800 [compost metagenome]